MVQHENSVGKALTNFACAVSWLNELVMHRMTEEKASQDGLPVYTDQSQH